MPICCKTLPILKTIFKAIKEVFIEKNPSAVLLNLATDGDPYRRKLLTSLRQPSGLLDSLDYFNSDLMFGEISINFDVKHLLKRLRGILISNCRQMCLVKRKISKSSISSLYPSLSYLLNPVDKQNVPYAVLLFKELSSSVPVTNPLSHYILAEIECLNEIVKPLLNIFVTPTINLFDQLIQLAYCAHLLFFIYRKWKKHFMTKDLYHDIQSTIQDAFIAAHKCQCLNPDLNVYLHLLGTDKLENVFSDIRTMTHSSSCDYLELIQRFKLALQIEKVYAKHPEWRSSSRISSTTTDHSSSKSWTGILNTHDLNVNELKTIWDHGYTKAYDYLTGNGFCSDDLSVGSPMVNMLNPIEPSTKQSQIRSNQEDEEEEEELIDELSEETVADSIESNISDALITTEASKFKTTVEYDGNVYFKSNAVANLIHCTSKLSNVRENRHFSVASSLDEGSLDERCIFITDLICTIIISKTDICRFICVMSIDKIEKSAETFNQVEIDKINEYFFTGTILKSESISDNFILWNGKYSSQIRINGALCCHIKSEFAAISDRDKYLCRINLIDLIDVKNYFTNFINQCGDLVIPKISFSINHELVNFIKFSPLFLK